MNHRYSYCKKDGPGSGLSSGPRRVQLGVSEGLQPGGLEGTGSPDTGPRSDSRTTTPPSQLDSDERESEDEDDEAMCMDDIRVVQVDDGECEIYEGNFEEDGEWEEVDEEAKRGEEEEAVEEGTRGEEEEAVEEEMRGEEVEREEEEEKEEGEGRGGEELVEEHGGERGEEDMVYEVVELELGEGQELEEEETEDKETSVGEDTVETEADEAHTDKCIREESDSVRPTEEVAVNDK